MEIDTAQQVSADPLPFARSYQLEALEKAIKQNTIVFLETGSGKTLIAIMLLRTYAYLLRKPSPFIAVFLVPQVVLVSQQAAAVKIHTDLKVGEYWGSMGVDSWDAASWKQEIEKHEVLVMTPAIFHKGLNHSFFKLSMIKVLIFDECHHARGCHSYACIMTEFYHRQLRYANSNLPRILGMTASPIKAKAGNSELSFWKNIHELETLMNSKVYTCVSESVLAPFIPFSTPKFKLYMHKKIPYTVYELLDNELKSLKVKHELALKKFNLKKSSKKATTKKISKILSALMFCLEELGVWLAQKAAQSFSCNETDMSNDTDVCSWGKPDVFSEAIVRDFSLDASRAFATYIPSEWSISDNVEANMDAGLLTSKVVCLIECLLEYRDLKDIRCIIFVQRVITAIVLHDLLNELLPKYNSWKSKYIAGNNSGLKSQTRKTQNEIVEEFRQGMVNIIVATSILEEGLDVQSCNLVIRFDPASTVCSFIQSRGRARMQNSDYLLMVKSEDFATQSQQEKFLASGDLMRKESLRHASLPCAPLECDLKDEEFYCVESTGATVKLSSSVGLIYFYCSRLPSDCYFKPTPRWQMEICTLLLPKSCPLEKVVVQGNCNTKILKQWACLEACKQLHKIGALTDNLVPDIVMEEAHAQEIGNGPYMDEQPSYLPPELIGQCPNNSDIMYHCYLIELKQNFGYDIPVHDIVLFIRSELESDVGSMNFDLDVERGSLTVNFKYVGVIHLSPELVLLGRRFQVTLFQVLKDRNLKKLKEVLDGHCLGDNLEIDFLLLPAAGKHMRPKIIDWECVLSVLCKKSPEDHVNCCPLKGYARKVQTKDGLVCTCMLQNSLVYTPHNDHLYCITGILGLNGNSVLTLREGRVTTYKNYYKERHGEVLCFENESLIGGRHIFQMHNYLQRCRPQKERESSYKSVELPPELCSIIMSPISISTFYSFSFVPSIMHRLESLLIAVNLKKRLLDDCKPNFLIPTIKVLEAITTKKCQEKFHLESLETLGDSFLKYAASQQLFKEYQNQHEGLLSVKKEKIISNAALCKFGCDRKLPGFIRTEPFDPTKWIIPGVKSGSYALNEELLSNTRKIYVSGSRKLKSKSVADVVESLIGAFLSSGGETAALLFMDWIGIKVDFDIIPYERHFQVDTEKHLNVRHLESLLNYSFRDKSLLLEAMTHGSYMVPEIPRCYQRLEFLGDSVVDYLMTLHFYNKYPGLSPELLTDMRSASVNNDCYARSAVKFQLHKHVLHASQDLHRHIIETVNSFDKLSSESTYGWETDTTFPKVLGDVIESLAGAILVDSGFNKDIVFRSMRRLLEPLITPETVIAHPAKELNELCQKEHFNMKKPVKANNKGATSVTIEVEANGITFKHTSIVSNKRIAKKLACKEVLKSLKEKFSMKGVRIG